MKDTVTAVVIVALSFAVGYLFTLWVTKGCA